jgi:hypothetical protein
MNLKKRLPHSPLAIAAYCLIIAIGIMFWGGPISVAGPVAELRIGEGSSSELALREGHRMTIVSGHLFHAIGKMPPITSIDVERT